MQPDIGHRFDLEISPPGQRPDHPHPARRSSIRRDECAVRIHIQANVQGIRARGARLDQLAENRIGAGANIDADATTIIDPGDLQHFPLPAGAWSDRGAYLLADPLDIDEFSRNEPDLTARDGADQSVMLIGRESVAMNIPPRAEVPQKLPLFPLRPALP